MRIDIKDAAEIVSMTPDELLMEAQKDDAITPHYVPPTDMIYNDDGTVQFVDGETEPTWEFEMSEVLEFKKIHDERKARERDVKIREAVQQANQELIGD